MNKVLLMFLVGVFALTANASVKVNKDLSGKVIIEVTGEAGRIGKFVIYL
ncbi:MAG: hypothetical protein ACFNYJ_10600 [Segatella oris]